MVLNEKLLKVTDFTSQGAPRVQILSKRLETFLPDIWHSQRVRTT